MKYNTITSGIIGELREICGKEFVLLDDASLLKYGQDETEDLVYKPSVVVRPRTAEEISLILKIANEHLIPVTPRGAGTGLSGGALAIHGGICLSMERFNRILEIDEKNLQATVEPGVINEEFQNAVKEKGLFYPPDPASKGSCFLGGNLAHSSGGPKAVKYGTTRDYVLNMEVVLPTGEIVWTGANVLKYSTGYNFTHLMIGSEGTLGVITKIVFRLIPYPQNNLLLLVPFTSAEKACEAVSAVFRAGITPSGMEFMERDAIDWVRKFEKDISVNVPDEVQAHLLIEVDGNDMDALYVDAEKISEVMQQFDCGEILFADTAAQKEMLWKMRRKVAEAVKSNSVYKEEDTVVPRASLPQLLAGVKSIGKKYGFKSVCYGHAGDGNLHVNIIKGDLPDEKWKNELPKGIIEIFELCVKLGGTISGEHGIGLVQQPYMPIAVNRKNLELMKGIKKLFDPNEILNPGKIFNS
ncbi:MAG TPA: FAD-linked oxidase C-terminal domain-containing protein [Bacteroidia bacterium]|jgi:glycolate oxidase|nr:FAD-linked oxidase C-terminal domain-containing protein [Bacteroidia bacterium]